MRGFIILASAALCLSGCAMQDSSTQQPFTGPVAFLQVTENIISPDNRSVFDVSSINGSDFDRENMQPAARIAGSETEYVRRTIEIPATQTRFTLAGNSVFSMPAICLASDDYIISGDVTFTPVAGATYIEKGIFRPDYSAVWIENAATQTVMGSKIEVHGNTAIPLVHKLLVNGCPSVPMG